MFYYTFEIMLGTKVEKKSVDKTYLAEKLGIQLDPFTVMKNVNH